ncbi:monosaccharide ABC transporter membrane protein (CUT2 family) [Motilibacter rhizosphaerae]|uniref:Monosaccharide ABC transporter membrane protein (CUT2 family) n=1 Tax=Motilibacter rhizosphaerae TaxID=598652 RepID=A0A4Q7NQ15_9ACTN|nr:ABC transporter permease [Motilibacter rhizosphaerae]RZS87424.1 monosaccharide ABC transporter membrane protein (CUT2 family) [Motilibacter rhizosphaerae]
MSTAVLQRIPRLDRKAVDGDFVRERGVYIALVLLILYNVFFTPFFNRFETVTTLMLQTPAVLIVSLGMLMVIGTGGIDLSVGATMAIAAAVMGKFVAPDPKGLGLPLALAIITALVAGLLVGIFNGIVVGVGGVQPIVATLSLLVGGRGIALVITSGALIELFVPGLTKLGRGQVSNIPYIFLIALALVVVVAVLVRQTTFGFRLLAIGGNVRAATLAGLPVRRTIITVYALSGLLAAIAGIIATARTRAADPSYLGLGLELSAITAVVVGGTALNGGRVRILGTVAGVILMQLLTTTLTAHNVPDSATQVAEALIIVGAVYIQRTSRSGE